MKFKEIALALFIASAVIPVHGQSTDPQQAPPADAVAEEAHEEPTVKEVADKVDAAAEAATETKNILDALNKLKISGYIQAEYVNDERSNDRLTNPTTSENFDQFRIRRGRVKFVYTATPAARFTLQVDVPTTGNPSLKDGFVELFENRTAWKNRLTAGQFNWPFGFEIGYSSSDREMPERSRVVRTLFPGERDRGVMISGAAPSGFVNYKLGVVNGTGTGNNSDLNSDKDIVGRVGFKTKAVDFGFSAYEGTDLVATASSPRGVEFDKSRQGVDFQLVVPFVKGMATRGEYIVGEERGADVEGWYWYLIQNIGTRHQFVFRVDEYDPNTDTADNATVTLGGSYILHIDPHAKIMAAYERPKLESNDADDNVATVRLQYKF